MLKPSVTWELRGRRLDFSGRGAIMGILNITPDSFSDGGKFGDEEAALFHARRMISEGADLIDVGGESTRPGAAPVEEAEELRRTIPVVRRLRREWDGPISIDTSKAGVAEAAIEAGAEIVNDVTGLRGDPRMAGVCGAARCGVVVMHMQGEPRTMQVDPRYEDVVAEVGAFFRERLAALGGAGIECGRICFDPGIGFGKTVEHNLALLARLGELVVGGRPLLVGVSRKSFLGRIVSTGARAGGRPVAGRPEQSEPHWPTVALTAWARMEGALVHRVHDVRPNREAMRMVEAIMAGDGE